MQWRTLFGGTPRQVVWSDALKSSLISIHVGCMVEDVARASRAAEAYFQHTAALLEANSYQRQLIVMQLQHQTIVQRYGTMCVSVRVAVTHVTHLNESVPSHTLHTSMRVRHHTRHTLSCHNPISPFPGLQSETPLPQKRGDKSLSEIALIAAESAESVSIRADSHTRTHTHMYSHTHTHTHTHLLCQVLLLLASLSLNEPSLMKIAGMQRSLLIFLLWSLCGATKSAKNNLLRRRLAAALVKNDWARQACLETHTPVSSASLLQYTHKNAYSNAQQTLHQRHYPNTHTHTHMIPIQAATLLQALTKCPEMPRDSKPILPTVGCLQNVISLRRKTPDKVWAAQH